MVLKCTVSYDGTNYKGWQIQPDCKTVQGEIENVLQKIHGKRIEVAGSGRTDTHVHALGQVFHFETDKEMRTDQWKHKLNCMLPKDIRIQAVERMNDDFHARFSCISKRYDYLVSWNMDDPFIRHTKAVVKKKLDVEKMKEASSVLLGTHDFTSFTSSKIHEEKDRVRTITRCEIIEHEDYVQMIFEGDGFLRYQIRVMAQCLIEIGNHKLTKEDFKSMLEACDKHVCRYKADPCGLYLVQVNYE